MKKIILTGGGSAGHITPNLALVPELQKRGFEVQYIGSRGGMEEGLVPREGIPFHGISAGKLRRYFSWQTFKAPFQVLAGMSQSKALLKELKPDVIFSKGGYVSFPVVYAAKKLHIPVIIHEADITPGLANKMSFPYATRVLCNFPETLPYLPKGKSFVSGCPIRAELKTGSRQAGLSFTGLSGEKPILLAMGGSLGSLALNKCLRGILPELLKEYDVVHLCGKGKVDESVSYPGYVQYEYISAELKDLLAMADFVISRAGANAICELLELRIPSLLIPLPLAASRGDQILNARSFERQGFSMMLEEETITSENLLEALLHLYGHRAEFIAAMENSKMADPVRFICDQLEEVMK